LDSKIEAKFLNHFDSNRKLGFIFFLMKEKKEISLEKD
jgi:hypothetical protein